MRATCLKCHKENEVPDGHKFNVCAHCGAIQAKVQAEAVGRLPPVTESPPAPSPSMLQVVAPATLVKTSSPFTKFCWLITALCAAGAALFVAIFLIKATGAPQQAAIAGIGCAIAIIPYVFTRAIEQINLP